MILFHSSPEKPKGLITKAAKFFTQLIIGEKHDKKVIDLRGANQAVKDFRNGFMPLSLHEKGVQRPRKDLLRMRYHQILKAEEKNKQKQSSSNHGIRMKVHNKKVQEFEDELRGLYYQRFGIVSTKSFASDLFGETPQNGSQKIINNKEGCEIKKGDSCLHASSQKQKNLSSCVKTVKKIEKQNSVKDQKETEKKNINCVSQNSENPFLSSVVRKINLNELIHGVKQSHQQFKSLKVVPSPNNEQPQILQNQRHEKSYDLSHTEASQFESSIENPPINHFQSSNQHSGNYFGINAMNIFGSQRSGTFSNIYSQQQSVAMFMPTQTNNNESCLFGSQQEYPGNETKERNRKKKNTKKRVYK